MRTCSEYRNSACAALKGNWSSAVVATIILALLGSVCGGTGILVIFVLAPLSMGYSNALKMLHREADPNVIDNSFSVGFKRYGRTVWAMLLMYIYITLWSLLLVIPGIIKTYAYAMTPYILQDEPDLYADAAIHRSREIMYGHKAQLFWLDISFIGWYLLGCITLGIGLLWVYPYVYTAHAAFYEDVKAEWEMKQLAAPVQE